MPMRLTPLKNPSKSIQPKKVRSQPPLPRPKTVKSLLEPFNLPTPHLFLRTPASNSLRLSHPSSSSEPLNASTLHRDSSSPVNLSNSARRSYSPSEESSCQASSEDYLSSLREGLGGPVRADPLPGPTRLNLSSFRLRYRTLNSPSRLYERWLQSRPSALPAIDFSILFRAKRTRANVASLKALASASMFDVKILEIDLSETISQLNTLLCEISDLRLLLRDFCRNRAVLRAKREQLKAEFYEAELKDKLISLEISQLEREIQRMKDRLFCLYDMRRNLVVVEPFRPQRYTDKEEIMRKLIETNERLACVEEQKLKEGEEVRRLNSELSQFNKIL